MDDGPLLPAGDNAARPDALEPLLRDALHPAYLLIRQLGEGGMGAVYLARDPVLKRDVAVKVLKPELAKDPVSRARFEREAESVAAIAHPNVINIYAVGALKDGTPYFVMQYATGRSLELRLEQDGPLSIQDTRRVLGEVASALAAAHKRGIIHRDIKPANVLQDGATGRVIVTDFGIAAVRQPGDTPSVRLTQTGMSPGTPYYMSPETLLNEEVTDRTDVYSLGIMGYELLTGAGPFKATSPHEAAAAHLRDTPAPLSHQRTDTDPDLEHLIATCLSKKPDERPSAEQIAKRLLPGEGVMLEWPPPGLETIAGRLPKLNRRLGIGSALFAVATLGMILADPSANARVPSWGLAAVAAFGLLLLLTAADAGFRLLRLARRAVRSGYAWPVVVEVSADARGDTGALITGTREYAPLGTARDRVRSWRIAGALCGFLAAVAPVPLLLVAIRFAGSGSAGPFAVALLTLGPSLLLAAVVWLLRFAEDRAVRRPLERKRRKKAVPPPVASKVVAAWAASLQELHTSTPLASLATRPTLGRLVVRIALLVAAVACFVVLPLIVVNPMMDVFAQMAVPKFSNTHTRTLPAEAGARWAPPMDSSITPLAAGQALQTLLLAGQNERSEDYLPGTAQLSGSYLPIVRPNPFAGSPAQIQDSLLRMGARRAFTPAQRAYLERVAANPGWPFMRTVARAPRIDVAIARYTPQALATHGFWFLSIPRYASVREAGYATSAVAALRLAEGRPADAESALRDGVGIGLGLMHNGLYIIETLIGATIANNALDRLTTFYEVTGRPGEASRIRAARDSARTVAERAIEVEDAALGNFSANPTAAVRGAMLRLATDSTMPASFRWEFVRQVGFLECTDARELVFGQMRDVDSALATFRRQVVRTPGDSLWFHKLAAPTTGSGSLLFDGLARALGNSRISGCGSLFAPR